MKKYIKSAKKFESKVCLVDKYGEIWCELIKDGMFWKLPPEAAGFRLDIGDEFHIEEFESETYK